MTALNVYTDSKRDPISEMLTSGLGQCREAGEMQRQGVEVRAQPKSRKSGTYTASSSSVKG